MAAQSTYERLKAASATPGVVAGHDVEIAERGLEAARAHVNALKGSGGAAEAAVKAVQEMEAYMRLIAPFDGVITERNVHPGSLIGPSTGALFRGLPWYARRSVSLLSECGMVSRNGWT